jgi:hypothetical protein
MPPFFVSTFEANTWLSEGLPRYITVEATTKSQCAHNIIYILVYICRLSSSLVTTLKADLRRAVSLLHCDRRR